MVINGLKLWSSLHRRPPIKDMVSFKVAEHGVSYGLGEAGYDIRLKQEIRFDGDYRGDRRVAVIERDAAGQLTHFTQQAGRFTIASAIEEFDMPHDLIGVVHDKSSWARRGLSVFNTLIEPGWKGWLTLELVYHGSDVLVIPAGAGIAQVVFHQIAEPASYDGKYQNQRDEPVAAIASV
ncbi:dCTP deaminase domain-containing protein [Paraburkholderia sp. SIMBA_054]|uniref:dCTP deaminase n=1 Tax=Paraburkholderia sp. SIMBA_054 TaxID=3085795 RepID=UPI00397E64D0